ncbi:MAG: hypothetical protein WBA91_07220 [Paracoccaceae bacterium]
MPQTDLFRLSGVALCAALFALAACNKDPAPMTKCVGDEPAVERILDAGPPNCP